MSAKPPTFLYVGVPKAGSTWLASLLGQHPDIFVPQVKEVGYFTRYYDHGKDWYLEHFLGADQHRHRGELTTSYLANKHAVARIAADLPGIQLLVTLRNPIARDYSHYLHLARSETNLPPFEKLVLEPNTIFYDLMRNSRYAELLEKLQRPEFPNTLYLTFDEITAGGDGVIQSLAAFLGVASEAWTELPSAKNTAKAPRSAAAVRIARAVRRVLKPLGGGRLYSQLRDSGAVNSLLFNVMTRKDRPVLSFSTKLYDRLQAFYEPHIEAAEAAVGRSLPAWREKPGFVELI